MGGTPDRKPHKNSLRLQEAILDQFVEHRPRLTIRQIFYLCEVGGYVPKTEGGYRQVQYQLREMRRTGIVPYGWIADNTRWKIKPRTFNGLTEAINHWQVAYRRDLWSEQEVHVEIWVEKDALAGVINPITQQYDVPLFVARGFSSLTFAYEAAEEIKAIGKPAYIYHFGDFDPSGVCAAGKIREELIQHGAPVMFERVAVTEEQINHWSLPTRGVKKTDTRAGQWPYPFSCELDAIPPQKLRDLVQEYIERHIDPTTIAALERTEEMERETLYYMANRLL
jgi:hypothetical protein